MCFYSLSEIKKSLLLTILFCSALAVICTYTVACGSDSENDETVEDGGQVQTDASNEKDTGSGDTDIGDSDGGEGGTTNAGGGDDGGEAEETKGILFASAPVQAMIYKEQSAVFVGFNGDVELGEDVDVVSIHNDFYGVPWDEFAESEAVPAYYDKRMDEIKSMVDNWGKPVYLSLSLAGGTERSFLDARAFETDSVNNKQDEWSTKCYNFSTEPDGEKYKTAYLRYVKYMVQKFNPAYLTIGIEINIFQYYCDGVDATAYDALKAVYNSAYDEIKKDYPDLPVFPTFAIGFILDNAKDGECANKDVTPCVEKNMLRHQDLKRDRFAISLYPYIIEIDLGDIDYEKYIDGVLDQVSGERFVVAETGYLSAPIVLNGGTQEAPQCLNVFEFSDDRQMKYFSSIINSARKWNMEFVTWWAERDLLPTDYVTSCPCEDEEGFCDLLVQAVNWGNPTQEVRLQREAGFKIFSTMGYRYFSGEKKPLYELFQFARSEERAKDKIIE